MPNPDFTEKLSLIASPTHVAVIYNLSREQDLLPPHPLRQKYPTGSDRHVFYLLVDIFIAGSPALTHAKKEKNQKNQKSYSTVITKLKIVQ
jgi:hypothetical protein